LLDEGLAGNPFDLRLNSYACREITGMRLRLNGWQRLWIVVAVLYLLVAAGVVAALLPTRSQIYGSWADAALQVAGEDLRRTQQYPWQEWELRELLFSKLTAEELVQKITDGARKMDLNDPTNKDRARYKEEILRLESTYRPRLDALSTERAKVVGWGVLGWAGPLAILYGFGLAVAWVDRGFRQRG
jgi:hypothetical protein